MPMFTDCLESELLAIQCSQLFELLQEGDRRSQGDNLFGLSVTLCKGLCAVRLGCAMFDIA